MSLNGFFNISITECNDVVVNKDTKGGDDNDGIYVAQSRTLQRRIPIQVLDMTAKLTE